MLVSNLSLLFLSISVSKSNSPFLSFSDSSKIRNFKISQIKFNHQFSTFFLSTANLQNIKIKKCEFNHFLNSIFHIESDPIAISGFSHINDNPSSPSGSFICRNAHFYNNSTPYNGACISVTTNSLISCNISYSQFTGNRAGIGGSLYFVSSTGNATIVHCSFTQNNATVASHAFLMISFLEVNRTNFQQSFGTRSSLQLNILIGVTTASFQFNECSFFRNEGPIAFESIYHTVVFVRCCFMDYNLTEGYPYRFNFFKTSNTITFENCIINMRRLTASAIYIDALENYVGDYDSNGDSCRLVPTPSQTNGDSWTSNSGIITIFTIVFFGVISIIGIIMVSCCKCITPPNNIGEEAETLPLASTPRN